MDTHSLTADDADKVNTATGFARNPQDVPADNPGAVEGDEYPCFNLPNGERWVFTGKGGFVEVEGGYDYPDESETDPENEDRYRAVWSDWDSLTDDEKRARVYPQGDPADKSPVPPSA